MFRSTLVSTIGPARRTLAFVLLCFLSGHLTAHSQVTYSFTQEQAPYVELESATALAMPVWDSVAVIDLGADAFRFFRREFRLTGETPFEVGGYGFVRAWDDSSVMVIDGLFTPLTSRSEGTSVSYHLDGTPGDRVLKVQWKNVGFPTGIDSDFANLQIWIHQRSGVIELRYGPSSVEGPNAFNTNGPWAGAFTSPSDFTRMTEKCWIIGDPAKPTYDTSRTFTFRRMTGAPAAGTLFRLTPRATLAVPESAPPHDGMLLIPNPANDRVRLAAPSERPVAVRIVDADGNVARRTVLAAGATEMTLDGLAAGAYLVEMNDAGRISRTKLLVR